MIRLLGYRPRARYHTGTYLGHDERSCWLILLLRADLLGDDVMGRCIDEVAVPPGARWRTPPKKPIETPDELRIHLARQVRDTRDEDLRRLIVDATAMLGCAYGHDYARQVVELVMAELGERAHLAMRDRVDTVLKVKL